MTTMRTPRAPERTHHRPWEQWTLAGVLVLVAANAVYGGIGLIVNGMGMPDDWLTRTPFDSWLLPGIALLVTVAVPQLWGLAVTWRGGDRAPEAALLVGLALVVWIVVQLLVLRRYFFLQPVIAFLGLAEAGLGVAWARRRGHPSR